MSVAIFIYQAIYCRYMCPGECIIHDMGSEFCNKLSQQLHECFGVEIRITSAGHPQSNGQAESAVKNVKAKMQAFMIDIGNLFCLKFQRCLVSMVFPMVFSKHTLPPQYLVNMFSPRHSVRVISPRHLVNTLSPTVFGKYVLPHGISYAHFSPRYLVTMLFPKAFHNILFPKAFIKHTFPHAI